MKNIKDALIIGLLIMTIIFGYFTFFQSDPLYKQKVKELEADNKRLQEERRAIDARLAQTQRRIDSLTVIENQLNAIISSKDEEIERNKRKATASRAELDKIKSELEKVRKQIEDAKKNPPNREGQDLINSLKIKTAK